jgi:uncharacterized membrane protein YheB (UPF0754 family)
MIWLWLAGFPLACGFIGWVTNVLAVKMIFRPYQPLRWGPLRFQGVLPKHLDRFSSQLATIIVSEFVTLNEMVRAVDATQLLERVKPDVQALAERLVVQVREALPPHLQALLTPATVELLRQQFEAQLVAELPETSAKIAERAEQVIDLQAVVARTFEDMGPKRVEQIIYEVSARELRFIETYGGVFGAVLGVLQLGIMLVFPSQWLTPIVGVIVGAVTNYLAIHMLFHPEEPRKLAFGVEYQGLFPRRQRQIAEAMGVVASRDVIRPVDVFEQLAERLLPPALDDDAMRALEQGAASRWPVLAGLAAALDPAAKAALLQRLSALYGEERSGMVATVARAAAEQLDIGDMVSRRVSRLNKTTFSSIIRGLFDEEELYLVIYGALLGGAIGVVQAFVTVFLSHN